MKQSHSTNREQNQNILVGYKKTDVGIIPEDWNVAKLQNTCSKITDGTHDTPKPVRSGVPFLTAIHVKDNWIDYQSCLYVTHADHMIIYCRCNPEKNDVLMVNIGAGVATTALVNVEYEFSLKNVALLKPDPKKTVGSYLNYSLAQKKPKITQALSSGGAQPFLSLTQIGEIEIPLPPSILEQQSIATTLSDADAYIDSLEKLIAKKRAIKKGVMQELLTGKQRLLGFSGEWDKIRLGDIATFYSGGTPPTSIKAYYGGEISWITSGDLNAGYIYEVDGRITESGLDNSSAKMIEANTLLIALYGATAGVVAISKISASINQAVLAIIPKNDHTDFLFYKLSLIKDWIIKTYTQGGQPNLSGDIVKSIEIELPSLCEQTAIAKVISDIDFDITAHEAKLSKARLIKQGMMQELLTGRIRLV